MTDIASLSNSLDSVSKLIRFMEKENVTYDELFLPVNDRTARQNLAAYLKAGCPQCATPAQKIAVIPTPSPFARNQHGHIIVAVTGLDLTGVQEVDRLLAGGYRVGDYARSCFLSTQPDSYDAHHLLVAGRAYQFALVPGKELKRNRTTSNLREHGMRKYGYGKPIGGSIPRIREAVSDEQMKEMKIDYITSLHDPITASDGSPDVLNANRGDDGPWVNTYWGDPDDEWDGRGAFAFPVSASQP